MDTRPNIVFVLTDDQGYGDLGCHGNAAIQTPHIDRFYQDAVRLTDYHVGSTCAPARAGILTGHYCNSAGVWHTIGGRSLLRRDEWSLAAALSDGGAVTHKASVVMSSARSPAISRATAASPSGCTSPSCASDASVAERSLWPASPAAAASKAAPASSPCIETTASRAAAKEPNSATSSASAAS